MDALKRAVFEDPTWVYAALAVIAAVLAASWFARRSRRLLAMMAIPVVLAGVVFAVERWVKTDREIIIERTSEIARLIESDQTALD